MSFLSMMEVRKVFLRKSSPLSGTAVYSHCFRPPSSVSLCRKTALTAFFILLSVIPKQQRS